MTAKNEILRRLRSVKAPSAELPEHAGDWIQYDDIDSQFATMAAVVGGVCHQVDSAEAAHRILNQLPFVEQAGGLQSPDLKVVCAVPDFGVAGVDLDAIEDPHQLADIDLAIVSGDFGVAENGAIWITDTSVRHRVIFFLPQHVAVVLQPGALVHNMHEAYDRLEMPKAGEFGMFLSGPSKTADIEQSLVIGAHGARSLTILQMT